MEATRDPEGSKEHSLTEPRSAAPGQATPSNVRADADTVGEASGGFLGGVSGMALGAMAGPVGLVLGGLAGALGGWWAGHAIADAITEADDDAYRADYERADGAGQRLADRSYEAVRPAYLAGHLAARNPDYAGRTFDEIEAELGRAWPREARDQAGDWPAMRPYARAAFERARQTATPN